MAATLANAHALFCGLKSAPSYLAKLDIGDIAKRDLMDARQKVRAALKAATNQIVRLDEYWEDEWRTAAKRAVRPQIEVKFMTQGSFAYKTINDPAQQSQEIDLDDGMYVPVEFLNNGQPALTAIGLFNFVVSVLTPLSRAQGWQGVVAKQNCVRVELWDGAHLDIPIYSIPRDQFATIVEAMAKSFTSDGGMTRTQMMDSFRLPSDKIMLARKDGTWIQSDPQRLQDWVEGRVSQYGPVFRRLCRFFKGWRDHTWSDSPLSSLCLMCAVDQALIEFSNIEGGLPSEDRDDLLVMEVAKRLPKIFAGDVKNPLINSCLNGWDDNIRAEIIAQAMSFGDLMIGALERTGDAEEVVKKLRIAFGQRLPYRPDSVKIAGSEITAIVHAQPIKNPAPAVIASTSG